MSTAFRTQALKEALFPGLAGSPLRPRSVGGASLSCFASRKRHFSSLTMNRAHSEPPCHSLSPLFKPSRGSLPRHLLRSEQWQAPAVQNGEVAMPSWYRSEKHCSSAGICHQRPDRRTGYARARGSESLGGNEELQRKTPGIEESLSFIPTEMLSSSPSRGGGEHSWCGLARVPRAAHTWL
jgi:hypothetical protein